MAYQASLTLFSAASKSCSLLPVSNGKDLLSKSRLALACFHLISKPVKEKRSEKARQSTICSLMVAAFSHLEFGRFTTITEGCDRNTMLSKKMCTEKVNHWIRPSWLSVSDGFLSKPCRFLYASYACATGVNERKAFRDRDTAL